MNQTRHSKPMQTVRRIALSYPEVEEGTSCNKCSFLARKKSFVYMGMKDDSYNIMLKLQQSLGEVEQLAAQQPDCYKVGMHGWVTLQFAHNDAPPANSLKNWIDESYRLIVPKQLVAMLPAAGPKKERNPVKKTTAKKTTAKKSKKPRP